MKKTEKTEITIKSGDTPWYVWGMTLIALVVAMAGLAINSYGAGYQQGVIKGGEFGAEMAPKILVNQLYNCRADRNVCQSELEQAKSALQLCKNRLERAAIFGTAIVCMNAPPEIISNITINGGDARCDAIAKRYCEVFWCNQTQQEDTKDIVTCENGTMIRTYNGDGTTTYRCEER